jgi:hydrogenase maturation protease
MASPERVRTVVLGIGNVLMADDGVGVAALDRLRNEWRVSGASLVDGSAWGMTFLHVIEEADRLLVFDAIDAGAAPGTLVRLEGAAVPRVLSNKLSPHQIDLREVLAVATLRGSVPTELVALGVQPRRVEMSTELSPEVEAQLDGLVQLGVATLRGWGVACAPIGVATHA